MGRILIVSTLLILFLTKSVQLTKARNGISLSSLVFQSIGRNVDIFLKGLNDVVDDDLQSSIREVKARHNASEDCYGCQVAFTIASHLFAFMNYTYNDLEVNFQKICQNYYIDKAQPLQGSRICGPVVKNYGHHVETIARRNSKSASEACRFLTFCSEEDDLDLPPPEDITLPPEWHPNSKSRDKSNWVPLEPRTLSNALPRSRNKKKSLTDEGILRIAQLTDIHVDEKYLEGSYKDCGMPLCCRQQPGYWPIGRIPARAHGEWECNVPPETTIKFIQKVQSFQPHIVLYTGDSPSHHLWDESLNVQMDATLWVAQQLAENIAEAPVYSTIGNHETFPSNLYWVEGADTWELHEIFLAAYSDLSGFTYEQEESIRDAGYYSVLIRPGLRLLSYNSNFGYPDNWYNVLNDLTEHYSNMTEFMTGVLENARSQEEKVIVIAHHPVGAGILEFDEEVTQLMTTFSDVIIFNTVGHMHVDEFRLFRDEEGQPHSVQFLAQSANSFSEVNPSVRLYYFDDETLELIDYEQHFMNLSDGNITLLYKATEEYDLPDLTPQSMQKFVWRMKTDPELFRKFWRNRVSATGLEGECPELEECREEVLCRLLTTTLHQWRQCVQDGIQVPTPTTIVPTTPAEQTQTSTPHQETRTPPGSVTTESAANNYSSSVFVILFCLTLMAFPSSLK